MNFTKLKALIGDLAAQIRTKQDERQKAIERREELESLPANKEDTLSWFYSFFDEMEAKFHHKLQLQMNGTFFQWSGLKLKKSFPLFAPWSNSPPYSVKDYAIIAILGPEIKKRLPEILDSIEFPETVGPSAELRRKEIASLDTKIAKLDRELEELRNAADAAGIRLD